MARTTDGGKRFISTRYHADRPQGDAFATGLGALWNVPVTRADIGTEGGNFLSDGVGGCLVTYAILSNPYNVTNHVTAEDVRTMFRSLYGCKATTFLDPIKGEVTGHVDTFAAFTGNKDVLVGAYSLSDDPDNAVVLNADAARLTAAGYQVHRVPMPAHNDGAFRSYTNSLAVNGAVLVPGLHRRHHVRGDSTRRLPCRLPRPADRDDRRHGGHQDPRCGPLHHHDHRRPLTWAAPLWAVPWNYPQRCCLSAAAAMSHRRPHRSE